MAQTWSEVEFWNSEKSDHSREVCTQKLRVCTGTKFSGTKLVFRPSSQRCEQGPVIYTRKYHPHNRCFLMSVWSVTEELSTAIIRLPAPSSSLFFPLHPLQAGWPFPCPWSLSPDHPRGPSPWWWHSYSWEVSRWSFPLSEYLLAQQAAVFSGNNGYYRKHRAGCQLHILRTFNDSTFSVSSKPSLETPWWPTANK